MSLGHAIYKPIELKNSYMSTKFHVDKWGIFPGYSHKMLPFSLGPKKKNL